MSRAILAASVALLVALAPCRGEAQMDGPTYQDSTGLTWSVASLEVGLILSAIAVATADAQSAQAIGLLALLGAVIAAGVVAGVTQAYDAPVEPAMVFHQGIVGGLMIGGTAAFSLRVAGERGETPGWVGLVGLLVGAAGAATYSVLRMERLAHDPGLLAEAHVLSWVPLLAGGLTAALLDAAGLGDAAMLIGSVVGLLTLGACITAVEVAYAERPPPEETMMTSEPLVAGAGWRF